MDWLIIARKLLPYAVGFAIGAALMGGAAWTIQGARVDSVKAELSQAISDLKVSRSNEETCMDANKINQATMGGLQEEVRNAMKGCDSRLASKERTLKSLKRISELKPGAVKGGTNETSKNNSGAASSGDPLLDELNRMYVPACNSAHGGKDGIRPAAGAGPAR